MATQPSTRINGVLVAGLAVALIGIVTLVVYVLRTRSEFLDKSRADEPLPLQFSADVVDVGSITAPLHRSHDQQEAKFHFTVWDKGPVTITKITPECAVCARMDESLVGKQLPPASTHTITGTFLPTQTAGDLVMNALVETSPPSPKPLILRVTFRSILTPGASPAKVIVESVPGQISVETELHLTTTRSRSHPQLRLNANKSSFPGFTVVKTTTKSTIRRLDPGELDPAMYDEVNLTLRADPVTQLGEKRSEWVIKWEGGEPDTVVPVIHRVVHPLVPKVESVFCGELRSGESWKEEIPLTRHGPKDALKTVTTSKSFLKATVNESADSLHLSLIAPSSPGRHEVFVELVFRDPQIPPYRIPVTMIVRK